MDNTNNNQCNTIFFWRISGPHGFLSNWYSGKFVLDGFTYQHVEQHTMAEKAKLFNDTKMYEKILRTEEPKTCKALGKKVTPFVPEEWNKVKYEIVKTANRAKFDQDPELKEKLLATGDAILAEASPRDRIWGIGMGAAKASELDPSEWNGQNLLGKILMELREEYRAG